LLKHIATLKQESDSFGSASTESYLKEMSRNAQRARDAAKELLAVGSTSVDDIVKEKKRAAARASKQASKGSKRGKGAAVPAAAAAIHTDSQNFFDSALSVGKQIITMEKVVAHFDVRAPLVLTRSTWGMKWVRPATPSGIAWRVSVHSVTGQRPMPRGDEPAARSRSRVSLPSYRRRSSWHLPALVALSLSAIQG
jgi:hypothetical protein